MTILKNPRFGYLIIITGLVLSFMIAVVPFYDTGYKLHADVLVFSVLPYVVYGISVVLFPHIITHLCGVIVVLIHSGLMVHERFLKEGNYNDHMVYYVPLTMAVLLLFLAAGAWYKSIQTERH